MRQCEARCRLGLHSRLPRGRLFETNATFSHANHHAHNRQAGNQQTALQAVSQRGDSETDGNCDDYKRCSRGNAQQREKKFSIHALHDFLSCLSAAASGSSTAWTPGSLTTAVPLVHLAKIADFLSNWPSRGASF